MYPQGLPSAQAAADGGALHSLAQAGKVSFPALHGLFLALHGLGCCQGVYLIIAYFAAILYIFLNILL